MSKSIKKLIELFIKKNYEILCCLLVSKTRHKVQNHVQIRNYWSETLIKVFLAFLIMETTNGMLQQKTKNIQGKVVPKLQICMKWGAFFLLIASKCANGDYAFCEMSFSNNPL